MQAMTEISSVSCSSSVSSPTGRIVAFLYLGSLWISGLGHLVDLGTIVSSARITSARDRKRRPEWALRVAVATVAIFSLVVIGPESLESRSVRVSVIIPTHNERRRLKRVLADLPSDLTTEVIVVDSTRMTGRPRSQQEWGPRDSGTALRYGQRAYGLGDGDSPDVVVFLDGDYSDRPSELPILLAPIIEGRATSRLGSRLQGRRSAGAFPWHQAFGNRSPLV